jgi:hypothetical protein
VERIELEEMSGKRMPRTLSGKRLKRYVREEIQGDGEDNDENSLSGKRMKRTPSGKRVKRDGKEEMQGGVGEENNKNSLSGKKLMRDVREEIQDRKMSCKRMRRTLSGKRDVREERKGYAIG